MDGSTPSKPRISDKGDYVSDGGDAQMDAPQPKSIAAGG